MTAKTHLIVNQPPHVVAWLRKRLPPNDTVIFNGDIDEPTIFRMWSDGLTDIYGDLPISLAAYACILGLRYWNVEFDEKPPENRELLPQELESYGIKLVEYTIRYRQHF